MANIKDIARIAGVSVTTVSRVINGHPYVSAEKREAVQRAMEAVNYERNINAVHLSRGKTNLIGVVVPSIRRPYFRMEVEGIAEEAIKDNYKLVLIQTNYETVRELDALMMLKGKEHHKIGYCLARKSSPNSKQGAAAYLDFYKNMNEAHNPAHIFHYCTKIMNITTFEIPIVQIGRRAFLQVMDGSRSHEEIPIHLIERSTV
ncbi:LacI family DNA-binding transcriptional regulator [Paenibacillus sp. S150]|uniref:LacI family DNA-binding transcriptional regulator n=1 Tax=Paenibacillus sp. S150 TaxID=2749826 RepID=UPI001C5A2164|nr:LacI family DNA-binding transcriptional regulator [Paenibacillus sp. S150]MBW4082637.1 LacI family DNA-binding transcriptional regulator [Paenibacillus sp. S150]